MVEGPGVTTFSLKRLWKSAKYDRAYLRANDTVSDARKSIMEYMD
jgi:putative transposase